MEYLTQELTETTFSREEELTFASCDVRKKMKLSTMLSMMASIAGYDYDARGLTHEKLYAMREVFLLSRMALRIHECPRYREVILKRTAFTGVCFKFKVMRFFSCLKSTFCHSLPSAEISSCPQAATSGLPKSISRFSPG